MAEANPLTPHDSEGEGTNITEPSANPSNKRSKNQRSGNITKKVKILDKTKKFMEMV